MFPPAVVPPPPEDLRPRFHFTARAGWLNDPNGLVYANGLYHLFYQHNPFGTDWGNMTWGHATSKDLIHWKDLPNALEPDESGTMFSGSAVIDKKNVSGLGARTLPPMLLFYTAAGGTNDASKGKPFTQCLASSTDGLHFTKFPGNPVVPHIEQENRDPKVVWDDAHAQWVMALYLAESRYALLGSKDLKQWRLLSNLPMPGTDECPDFFQLPLDGHSSNPKWVFSGANGHYSVGEFDGVDFHPQTDVIPSIFGNTGYAAQTYTNAPRGRRIQIAWMNNSAFPGCPWNQLMCFPTELSLRTTTTGPRLFIRPVREIESLRGPAIAEVNGTYSSSDGLFDISGEWHVPASGSLHITVNGVTIAYDSAAKHVDVIGRSVALGDDLGKLNLRILADRTSLEIYAQEGAVWMPFFVLPKGGEQREVRIETTGMWRGKVRVFPLEAAGIRQ